MAHLQINSLYERHFDVIGLRSFQDFYLCNGEVIGGHLARNVATFEAAGLCGFLKREHRTYWKDYWASWWAGFGFASKSKREWNILHALRKRGLMCPEPLAVGQNGSRAFLLVRELPNAVDLHTYLARRHYDSLGERKNLASNLGKTLSQFHAAGFTHPDLYAKHVFVSLRDGSIAFIDFQRTRWRRWVRWSCRWRDLAALDASLGENLVPREERLTCLATYLRHTFGEVSRPIWQRSLTAITRRTQHLLRRRKIQEMRHPPVLAGGISQMEYFRVSFEDGLSLSASGPVDSPPPKSEGRW